MIQYINLLCNDEFLIFQKNRFHNYTKQMDENHIKLHTNSIMEVPLIQYDNNFTFIVNGKEFKTSRIIADLLSPLICQMHSFDPTIDTFTISTYYKGNFSYILGLINFDKNVIPDSEIPFISEVINFLDNKSIEIHQKANITITNDNVFELIKMHEKYSVFYTESYQKEIEYISSHFFELNGESEEFSNLALSTLERIFENANLQLESEDQLLSLINHLYLRDKRYSILFEFIEFSNLSQKKISEFLSIFDFNDITHEIWEKISFRLEQNINQPNQPKKVKSRYIQNIIPQNSEKSIFLPFQSDKEFNGIINYLSTQSRGNIFQKINISSSSTANENESFSPINSILYEDETRYFLSGSHKNSWLCFDFKKHRIIPTNYTIRSFHALPNEGAHPKSWVIEGSNDNHDWTILDKQKDCPLLNGMNLVHTFSIKNPEEKDFRFIRIRQTMCNWVFSDCLCIDSIEFYGYLL